MPIAAPVIAAHNPPILTFELCFEPLDGVALRRLAAEPDNEYAMMDSTIVRAHQHSAGAPKKRR